MTNSRVLSGKDQNNDTAPLITANKRVRYFDNGTIYEIIHFIINNNEYQVRFRLKNDIFTRKNNMLSAHVKISPLLWPGT